MNKIVVYQGPDIVQGCKLALKNRLYISGWSLSGEYKYAIQNKLGHLALLFVEEIPVSAMLRTGASYTYEDIQAFTKLKYRRRGFATLCYEALGSPKLPCGPGVEGSDKFWNSIGLEPC